MMLQPYFATLPILVLLLLCSQNLADLDSEKQALLSFAASIHHSQKINWKPATSICTSWVGITCSLDGSHVFAVRLPGVGLRGSLPANTLSKLNGLKVLSLRSNSLSGNLPSDILSLPSLRFLYLQHNNFTGEIPNSFPPRLRFLDLSYNIFTGKIPALIQSSKCLTGLNLQNNFLSGHIPDIHLPRLKNLNLSYNYLNGPIPSTLQKFPASSFTGNLLLCGPPLNQCSSVSPSSSPSSYIPKISQKPGDPSKKKLTTGVIVAIAFVGTTALFVLLLLAALCCFKKKVKMSEEKNEN